MNSCGTIDNKPALSKNCQDGTSEGGGGGGSPGGGMGGAPVPVCMETWECTDWTKCTSDSLKYRNCIDTNNCGTTEEKPFDLNTCQYPGTCVDGLMNGDEKGIDCGGRCENKCQTVPENIETKIEIIAEPIISEIFDEIVYSVIIRNAGTKKAGDISVSLDKWAEPAKTRYTISPGKEKTIEFSLKMTGDYSVDSLQVQVLYGNTPLKTTSVPVDLKVPEYAVKGIRKGDELYAIAIVDNRESESRQLEVSYEIINNNKILLKRSMSLSAKSESVLQQTDDRQILLPEGKYEIVSVFYENGQKIGEYRTTIEAGQKTAPKSKIYIAIPIVLVIVLVVLLIVMKKKKKKH